MAANQIYFSAWQILPGFTLVCAALSWLLIRIVIRISNEYGLSAYALEVTVRVLVLELIPLFAALFVGLRSGAAINTEVVLMHIRGDLDAQQRAGRDPLRHELVPRVIGSAVSVTLLAFLNCAVALLLTYYVMYGASPWGLPQFLRITGEVLSPLATIGLGLKTLLFGSRRGGDPDHLRARGAEAAAHGPGGGDARHGEPDARSGGDRRHFPRNHLHLAHGTRQSRFAPRSGTSSSRPLCCCS